jgi:hypothetical protein
MTQEPSSHPVLPTFRAISAATMKIPDPIIDPATIIVESNSPKLRLSSLDESSECGLAELGCIGRF